MRFLWLLLPSLSFALAGCISANNDQVATYQKVGDRYVIEVTGTRVGMAHDVGQLLEHKTYKDRWQFDVPRIEGKIEGKEIRPKPGTYPYVGSITIHERKMIVKLFLDNYDFHRLDAEEYNGSYILVEKIV